MKIKKKPAQPAAGMTDGCFLGCRAVGALMRTVEKVDDERLREVLLDKAICDAVPSGKTPALTTVQRFANAVENFALMELCSVLTKADVVAIARARESASKAGSGSVHEMILEMGLGGFLEWAPPETIKSAATALGLTAVEGCSEVWFGTQEARHAVADELAMVGLMRMLLAMDEETLRLFCRLIRTRVLRVATRESIIDHAMRVVFELVCFLVLRCSLSAGSCLCDLQRPVKKSHGRDDSDGSDDEDGSDSESRDDESSSDGDDEDEDDVKGRRSGGRASPAKRTRTSLTRTPSKRASSELKQETPAKKGRVSPARKRSHH